MTQWYDDLKVVDATDLIKEPVPERSWLVEGLIERQDRLFLTGAEGARKSLLSLTLAIQASAGLKGWGRFPTMQGLPLNVVVVDMELSRVQLIRRLRLLAKTANTERKALHVLSKPEGIDLTPRTAPLLVDALAPYEPDLIVIDPLYKLSMADLKDDHALRAVIASLDVLRVQLDAALLVCHHLRKAGSGQDRGQDQSDMFGSSILLRWPETILTIRNEALEVQKDRNGNFDDGSNEPMRLPLKLGGEWPVGIGESDLPLRNRVLDIVKVFGPCSATRVCQEVRARRQDVIESLKRLATEGLIVSQNGKWRET